MQILLLNILLAGAWGALTGNFDPGNLLFGFFVGYLILWLLFRSSGNRSYFLRVPQVLEFVLFFLYELMKANLRVASTVLSPRLKLRPAVVAVPLDIRDDTAITLLMNLLTLTPGTLALDVSNDRQVMFIHALWIEDPEQFRREIKSGFERRVKELFE